MSRSTIALILGLLLLPVLSLTAQAQSAITEQEAHAIGVDAYIYFYSLVTMDVTRKQMTNMSPGKGFGARWACSQRSHISARGHESGGASQFRHPVLVAWLNLPRSP